MPRKTITVKTKLEAVEFGEKNSGEAASRKYGVDAKYIRTQMTKVIAHLPK